MRTSARDGVLILTGPTCAGKSALALDLAERFDGEIIGADSRQIYRGMPVGTAAPTQAELARVPHHLIGFLDPSERYSAARFAHDALAIVAQIHARGKRALVVGGTGFYIRALAGDVALSSAYDASLRGRLAREARVHPPEVLHAWLRSRDAARAAVLAPADGYRVLRALEIALLGRDEAASVPQSSLRSEGIAHVKIALAVPQEELDRRIARRVEAMLASGLLDEADRVGREAVAADAVGYPQALAFLDGFSTRAELRATLERATRRFSKRQRTWLRSEPGTRWTAPGDVAAVARTALGW